MIDWGLVRLGVALLAIGAVIAMFSHQLLLYAGVVIGTLLARFLADWLGGNL